MSTSSNRTVRDVVVFVIGAGIATSVLIGMYILTDTGVSNDERLSTIPVSPADSDTTAFAEQAVSSPLSNRSQDGYDVASLADILSNYSGSFDRFAALYSLVAQSHEQELVDLFNESLNYEYGDTEHYWIADSIRSTILSKLVYVNEDVADSLFLELDRNQQAQIATYYARELALIDLDRAVDLFSSLDRSVKFSGSRGILDLKSDLPTEELTSLAQSLGDDNYIQHILSRGTMKEDTENPQEAWANLSADPDFLSDENWMRIQNIVEAWIEQEGVSVLDTVTAGLEDEDMKQRIISNALRTLSEDDPAAAFEYALQFDSEGSGMFGMSHNPYMYSVLSEWAEDQPLEALDRLMAFESTTHRDQHADSLFRYWASSDVQDLIQSIPRIPRELQDAARASSMSPLLYDSSAESIDDVLALFAEIEDDTKKSQAAGQIAYRWAEKDPEAALNWAQTDPSTESVRSQLTNSVLSTLARKNPQKAFDIALEMPLNDEGLGLEAAVISSLTYSNINKALEFLPKVRSGETQKTAYMGVGGGLAMQGRVDEAFELGKVLSEEDQLPFYTSVGTMALSGTMMASITGNESEVDVFDTIDSIPLEAARSMVAKQAILMDKMSDSYTDEQIETLKEYLSEEELEQLEKDIEEMDTMMPSMPFFGF